MGFGADIKSVKEIKITNILKDLHPEDLIKYGLIPEFVGRLPIVANLDELDKKALKRILTEPKNALIKQYKKIFSFDNVELDFSDASIEEIANIAIKRESGARGLRSVLETIMLDLMYEIPSKEGISRIKISGDVIRGKENPKIIYDKKEKSA
jgi:ATP-dependent Clp protease ATP-binding subunit ClpX